MECASEYRLQPESEHSKPTYTSAMILVLVLQPLVEFPIIDNHIPLPLRLFTDLCGMSQERLGTLAPVLWSPQLTDALITAAVDVQIVPTVKC